MDDSNIALTQCYQDQKRQELGEANNLDDPEHVYNTSLLFSQSGTP